MNQVITRTRGRGRPSYDLEDAKAADNFKRVAERFVIDRADPAPLWVQVKNQISEAIRDGSLPAESRLPSEQALCSFLEVSKPVIRSAIHALANENQVVKMPRKGMFVSPKRTETDFLSTNLSVFGDLTTKGFEVSAHMMAFTRRRANGKERQFLNLPESGSVVHMKRMYRMNGRPITLSWISLPAHKVPDMDKLVLENTSIHEALRHNYGIEIKGAERWFTAEMPDEEISKLLELPPLTPVIGIESVARDQQGDPIEYYYSYYDSSIARIHVSIGK